MLMKREVRGMILKQATGIGLSAFSLMRVKSVDIRCLVEMPIHLQWIILLAAIQLLQSLFLSFREVLAWTPRTSLRKHVFYCKTKIRFTARSIDLVSLGKTWCENWCQRKLLHVVCMRLVWFSSHILNHLQVLGHREEFRISSIWGLHCLRFYWIHLSLSLQKGIAIWSLDSDYGNILLNKICFLTWPNGRCRELPIYLIRFQIRIQYLHPWRVIRGALCLLIVRDV